MRVKITTTGIDELLALLRIGATMFDDLTPLMRQYAGIMMLASEDAFAGERDPDGRLWAQLADSTARRFVTKQHRRGAHPILQVSGQLAASITPDYGRDFAQVGTNKVYAAIQQFGGMAGRKKAAKIPARAYIGLGASAIAQMESLAVGFIGSKLARR